MLGGVGGDLSDPDDLDRHATAHALRTGNVDHADPIVELAEALGADPIAAAALYEGLGRLRAPKFSSVRCPVRVIAGENDDMAGGAPDTLARQFEHGDVVTIPGADHLAAIFDPTFVAATIELLDRSNR